MSLNKSLAIILLREKVLSGYVFYGDYHMFNVYVYLRLPAAADNHRGQLTKP